MQDPDTQVPPGDRLDRGATKPGESMALTGQTLEPTPLRWSGERAAAAEKDYQTHNLANEIGERELRTCELGRALQERRRFIDELTKAADASEKTIIDELTQAVDARNERIAALSRTLDRRERQMVALNEELRRQALRVIKFRDEALQASALREQVRAFANSKSWRLAAPLRAIGRVARGIRQFFRPERSLLLPSDAHNGDDGAAQEAEAPLSQNFLLSQIYAAPSVANEAAPIQSKHAPEVRALAFYLPQYHRIPENDAWWGEGFTDWHNVQKSRPLFTNHAQPRTPSDLGYYDLSLKETIEKQAAMIRLAGLEGVCIYYYWFNGKRLLEKPLELIHTNPDIDLDYCLCWANENWTRAWDGSESDVLIAQEYSEQDDLDFITNVSRYFSDKRYIRVHDKPLLLIYRLDLLSDPKASTARWREYCINAGIGEIFVVTTQFTNDSPEDYGADAGVEFPPHGLSGPALNGPRDIRGLSASFDGGVHDYNEMVLNSTARAHNPRIFRAATMGWDNTARKPNGDPTVFINATPARYERWLSRLCAETKSRKMEERLVFINAWNEWAEGVYLEPDRDCGYAYVNATRRAISNCEETIPRIAVVLHLFYWDLVDELADHISNMPFPFDLFVTATEGIYPGAFSYFNHRFPQASVNVVEVENRARDIGPFLTKFTSRFYDYDLVCKGRCCTARSKLLTSLCRWQSHPAQYVSGIPSAVILLSISHPIRCSTRCLANVRVRISGPMIAL